MFNPGLEIGQTIKNNELMEIFQCGMMGGMRRAKATNTLVLISDYTKGLYHDKWIAGTLHYTGMGKIGDMNIDWAQNATLAHSKTNGVDLHLFEVIEQGEYIYCGHVELVGLPYTDRQPDENDQERLVWVFPIRPVPENDVRKPEIYNFVSQEDFEARGKYADEEYEKLRASRSHGRTAARKKGIIGKQIRHITNGTGKIVKLEGNILTVKFNNAGTKTLDYKMCVEHELIEFIV